jgi:hypothetical protein
MPIAITDDRSKTAPECKTDERHRHLETGHHEADPESLALRWLPHPQRGRDGNRDAIPREQSSRHRP